MNKASIIIMGQPATNVLLINIFYITMYVQSKSIHSSSHW